MPTIRAVETNGAVTIEAVVTIDINSPQWMPGETAMLASIGSPRDKLGRALRIATGDALASLIDNAVVTTVARADEQATSDRETDNLMRLADARRDAAAAAREDCAKEKDDAVAAAREEEKKEADRIIATLDDSCKSSIAIASQQHAQTAAQQLEEIKRQAVTIEELNQQVKQRNADFDYERNRANDLESELNALKAAAKKRTRPASASKKPTAKSQQKPRPASR